LYTLLEHDDLLVTNLFTGRKVCGKLYIALELIVLYHRALTDTETKTLKESEIAGTLVSLLYCIPFPPVLILGDTVAALLRPCHCCLEISDVHNSVSVLSVHS
jgi:hypothetical protein